jgi:hypothetical protein
MLCVVRDGVADSFVCEGVSLCVCAFSDVHVYGAAGEELYAVSADLSTYGTSAFSHSIQSQQSTIPSAAGSGRGRRR